MSWEREVRWNMMRRRAAGDHPAREIRRWRLRCFVLAAVAALESAIIVFLLNTRN